jgi:hypothetical protein
MYLKAEKGGPIPVAHVDVWMRVDDCILICLCLRIVCVPLML